MIFQKRIKFDRKLVVTSLRPSRDLLTKISINSNFPPHSTLHKPNSNFKSSQPTLPYFPLKNSIFHLQSSIFSSFLKFLKPNLIKNPISLNNLHISSKPTPKKLLKSKNHHCCHPQPQAFKNIQQWRWSKAFSGL